MKNHFHLYSDIVSHNLHTNLTNEISHEATKRSTAEINNLYFIQTSRVVLNTKVITLILMLVIVLLSSLKVIKTTSERS
jgi:hypothetical protein